MFCSVKREGFNIQSMQNVSEALRCGLPEALLIYLCNCESYFMLKEYILNIIQKETV